MNLRPEKIFPFFFCLLAIYSQTVPAQQNKFSERLSNSKTSQPISIIEKFSPASDSHSLETGEKADLDSNELNPAALKNDIEKNIKNFKINYLHSKAADENKIKEPVKNIKERSPFQKEKQEKHFQDFVDNGESGADTIKADGFNWRGAVGQSLIFLGVQHGYAILGQKKTREALKGKFWKDYADSVNSLHGWDDGGKFFTNYLAHPMQGAFNGHIYVQNSPQARREQFSMTEIYWKTRIKAMLWTAAWSTQFEIGPVSQASIGNVGLKGKQTWEDIVVTPTLGTTWLVGEDFLDRFVIKNIERRTNNFYLKIFSRMLFNPTRNFSNILRFKEPWYRDR